MWPLERLPSRGPLSAAVAPRLILSVALIARAAVTVALLRGLHRRIQPRRTHQAVAESALVDGVLETRAHASYVWSSTPY